MTPNLSEPLNAFFEAMNAHDTDALLGCFAPDAFVRDEGANIRGLAAIRTWNEATIEKYAATAAPDAIEQDGETTVVRALVSGTFDGSPIALRYRFKIVADKIDALEIGD